MVIRTLLQRTQALHLFDDDLFDSQIKERFVDVHSL